MADKSGRLVYRNRNSGAMRISTSAFAANSAFELVEGSEAADLLGEHDEIVTGKREAAQEARRTKARASSAGKSGNGRRKAKPTEEASS